MYKCETIIFKERAHIAYLYLPPRTDRIDSRHPLDHLVAPVVVAPRVIHGGETRDNDMLDARAIMTGDTTNSFHL